MKKFALAGASIALASVLISTTAFADSPGRLATGATLFQVRNITKSGTYASSTSASCGETVRHSVEIANTQYGLTKNVTVTAPLNGTITVTGTNENKEVLTSSGKTTVTATNGTLAYVTGSSTLVDATGKQIKALPDTLLTHGVNIGDINGSTEEYVQYQSSVKCETPTPPVTTTKPTTPTPPVTETKPTTPSTPPAPTAEITPVVAVTPATPTPLPSTGISDTILPTVALAGLGASTVYAIRGRRSSAKM